jgi:pyrroloquinoline-quinone synthase
MDFFERLEAARGRWNVLEHPFYQRWTEGDLTHEQLAFYAAEYRHAVKALADACTAAAESAEAAMRAEIELHACEERHHVALWEEFAGALNADTDREPLAETLECASAWTAAGDALSGLAILYAVESGQPAISKTKLDGLVDHYGMEAGTPATEYFELHAELDHEHAAHSRSLLEERLADVDQDRLAELAEDALKGNWTLLDGVERRFESG